MKVMRLDNGKFQVEFETPFIHGDLVEYESEMNGSGRGAIGDINVLEDGELLFTIIGEDEAWQPGILEEEIKLIKRASQFE
ncbi:MAG: hypothetical protein E3J72_12375 [Planctomycetota bacterium]|nr:MAG: hypothetical protein E3J72_12375 [Planctomycetota bacterium]